MKDRIQIFTMGVVMTITIVLIVSICARQFNIETKASKQESVTVVIEEKVTSEPEYTISDASYFDDALFIGDSRTVGLCEYGTLENADYFAGTGMSVYKLWDETISVKNVGKVSLKELLGVKDYKKIYIMLGINELGYKFEKTIEKYEDTIDEIRESEKDAIIYVCANLHVTKSRSDKDELINNKNIDAFNQELKTLTDKKMIYYIDVNEEFDDENGNLHTECSGDGVHVYAKYYQDWSKWLCENTVQRGK